jgi:DNA adenine methylase
MKPPFCRQGNKYKHLHSIIPLIPEHHVYIEPFVGSGAVFWNKPKAEKNILNDMDKELIQFYKNLKTVKPKLVEFDFWKTPKTKLDKILHYKQKVCGGFNKRDVSNKIYRHFNVPNYIKSIQKYQDALQDVILDNKDYKQIIKKYDSKDSFFFIDPPYENTDKTFYKGNSINYHELNNLLENLNGKFILTINDSPNIRDIFKQFNLKKYEVKFNIFSEHKIRNELIITNF